MMGLLAHCVHWTMLQSGRSTSFSQPVDVIRLRIVPSFTVRMTFDQGVPGWVRGTSRAATARFGRVEAKPVLVRLNNPPQPRISPLQLAEALGRGWHVGDVLGRQLADYLGLATSRSRSVRKGEGSGVLRSGPPQRCEPVMRTKACVVVTAVASR